MKVITIALASAFALSSTFALAKTVRHEPSVTNTYNLQRAGIPLVGSGSLYPNYGYGYSDGAVSAGGYQSNGRSNSERGGDCLETR